MDIGDFLGRDALGDELVSYVVIDVGTGRDWRREMAEDKLGRPPGLRGAKGDGFNVPVIEQACLELARKAGLVVPRTARVALADGRDVMLIQRFDRKAVPEGFAKTHCVSALTLLGKHTSESLGTPYAQLAQKIGEYGVDGHVIDDRVELFARVAFSILVSNDDDHLRNHAFLWDARGRGWRFRGWPGELDRGGRLAAWWLLGCGKAFTDQSSTGIPGPLAGHNPAPLRCGPPHT